MKFKPSDDEEYGEESFIVEFISMIRFQILASLENKYINLKKNVNFILKCVTK